jgi:antitoxin component YwqK of YwqJK toxin-antitoxin module
MQVRRFCLIAIATLGFGVAFSPLAQAGETVFTGPNGRATTVNTERQRTENGATFQRTTTYPNGQTSSASGGYTRTGNGGYERGVVYTGPNGKQTSVNGTGTYQNGVLNGNRTVVYPNGQSRTSTFQHTR